MKQIVRILVLVALATSSTLFTACAQTAQVKQTPYRKSVHAVNPTLPDETAAVKVGWRDTVRTGARYTVQCQPVTTTTTSGKEVVATTSTQRTIVSADYHWDLERRSILGAMVDGSQVIGNLASPAAVAYGAHEVARGLKASRTVVTANATAGASATANPTVCVTPTQTGNLPVAPVPGPTRP
jgi:hypothetical protein